MVSGWRWWVGLAGEIVVFCAIFAVLGLLFGACSAFVWGAR